MDMRFEATPAEATAVMPAATVKAVKKALPVKTIVALSQVVSFSCPSIAGHSLSAVAPDFTNFGKELAEAA